MRQLPQANFDQALSLVYEKMTNRPSRVLIESKSNDLTELVAHREHIADDLAEMGYEDDELVDFVETYIKAAIETVLDHPEWFRAEENAEQSVRDELNRAAERKSEERNRDIIARGGPGNALPTSRGLGQVDTSYKGANSERGTGSAPSMRPGKRTSASQRVRDELNRAAERKSRERNRDIIARGGPGDALPTDGRY
jgi:hypothetical protein